MTSPRTGIDGRRLRRLSRHRAPVPATRGGALPVRSPQRTAQRSTRYSPQPPGPSGAATGRSGSSKPGPSSSTLRCTRSAASRSWTSTEPSATPVWRTALATSSVASRRRSCAVRGPSSSAERRERGGDVARGVRRRREALGHARPRRDLHAPGRRCRRAGCRPRCATAVRSRCSTTARGAVGGALGDQRGEVGLVEDAAAARRPRSRRRCRRRAGRPGTSSSVTSGSSGRSMIPSGVPTSPSGAARPRGASDRQRMPGGGQLDRARRSSSSSRRASATVTKPGARWRSSASLRRASR